LIEICRYFVSVFFGKKEKCCLLFNKCLYLPNKLRGIIVAPQFIQYTFEFIEKGDKMAGNTLQTWEKVLEYASVPLHGTMSRKIRKGVKLQINEGKIYEEAVLFISDLFLRVTEDEGGVSITIR
jgi:hypothetical protein